MGKNATDVISPMIVDFRHDTDALGTIKEATKNSTNETGPVNTSAQAATTRNFSTKPILTRNRFPSCSGLKCNNSSRSAELRTVASQFGHFATVSSVTQIGIIPSHLSTVLNRKTSIRFVSEQEIQVIVSSELPTTSLSSDTLETMSL